MDPTKWKLIRALFEEVRNLPCELRESCLEERCRGDPDLQAEVESLLSHYDGADGFMEIPALEYGTDSVASCAREAAEIGQGEPKIGRYSLTRIIGRGGMGIVWEAVQEEPRRIVALKVLKKGIASSRALRRFKYEVEFLGRLRHPGIAQIFEAGIHSEQDVTSGDDGVPYFAMEFVPDAKTIIEHARMMELKTRECLKLFSKVCNAVHHGHQKGIIHRDLKPANILVDDTGQPKIIDFGVARSTDYDLTMTTAQTDVGQLVGTVQYMSPEQCDADPESLDIRTDVYSLGVVLYELLCGRPPYDASSSSIYRATRIIKEIAPVPLSDINRRFKGDVDTIVLKSLEKDKERRYQSAAILEGDIRRYLDNRPITARPPSLTYQFAVFVRHHKTIVGSVCLAFLCLITVLITILVANIELAREKERVEAANIQLEREKEKAETRLCFTHLSNAQSAILQNDIGNAERECDSIPIGFRGWEWHHLKALLNSKVQKVQVSKLGIDPFDSLVCVKWSRDGSWVLAGRRNGGYLWYDAPDGVCIEALGDDTSQKERSEISGISGVAFSADNRSVAFCFDDGRVELRDCSSREKVIDTYKLKEGMSCCSVAYGPNGRWVFIGTTDPKGFIEVWDTETDCVYTLRGHSDTVKALTVNKDGKRLASGSHDNTIMLWNISNLPDISAVTTLRGHRDSVLSLAFSSFYSDRYLISGSIDGDVRIWDVPASEAEALDREEDARGFVAATVVRQDSWVTAVAACPTGPYFAFAGGDRAVKVWKLKKRDDRCDQQAIHQHGYQLEVEEVATFRGHEDQISDLDFSPDGREIVSASYDGTIRIWNIAMPRSIPSLEGHQSKVNKAVFTRDGRYLATAGGDASARIWDVETCQEVGSPLRHLRKEVRDLVFCENDRYLATVSMTSPEKDQQYELTGQLCLWDWGVEERIEELDFEAGATAIGYCESEKRLAVGFSNGEFILWRLNSTGTLEKPRSFAAHHGEVTAIAFSPDGRWVASGSEDETVRLEDLETDGAVFELPVNGGIVLDVAFCPDPCWSSENWIATASQNGEVTLWNALTRDRLCDLPEGHRQEVRSVAFSPDGARLASGAFGGIVKLWDPVLQECVITLKSHVFQVHCVTWGRDPEDESRFRLAATGCGYQSGL